MTHPLPLIIPPSSGSGLDRDPGASAMPLDPLEAGTFRSILPIVDELLSLLADHGAAPSARDAADLGRVIAEKAKMIKDALGDMKAAALNLPGGDMTLQEIRELGEMWDAEAERRRATLRASEAVEVPTAQRLAEASRGQEEESSMPTPFPAQTQDNTGHT